MLINQICQKQKDFFLQGKTKSLSFRLDALRRLEMAVKTMENKIYEALYKDLNKPECEVYMTEIGMVLEEISFCKRHIKKWSKNKRVRTPLAQFPSKSFIISQPLGCVLIMAPWNYPFQLAISPLISAICAGNCAIVKPSAYASATSAVIKELINSAFEDEYVTVVEGGRNENTALLEQKFDYIFFTGSMAVGKKVMEYAAKNLTPFTLELGGKSPCIVDKTADIALAAKRIVFGKFLNAGQTCVAPDYLLVQKDVEKPLLEFIRKYITEFFGPNPEKDKSYNKIINQHHYDRLVNLIEENKSDIYFGGKQNPINHKISPCVIVNQNFDSLSMEDEIFGPILPIITFDCINEIIPAINSRAKPLALYLFTKDKDVENRILGSILYGGGCINDTIIHLASPHMGFGGVGESGMGSYHGKAGFDTFSHKKSIVNKSLLLDLPMRYRPYTQKKLSIIKKFMK